MPVSLTLANRKNLYDLSEGSSDILLGRSLKVRIHGAILGIRYQKEAGKAISLVFMLPQTGKTSTVI